MIIDLKSLAEFYHFSSLSKIDFCDQVCIDTRAISSSRALFIALVGTKDDGHNYLHEAERRGARFALVRSSFSTPHFQNLVTISVPDPLEALQWLARQHRMSCKAQVIAITGSRGKTLLKDLLFHIFKNDRRCSCSAESYNSQIGVALSLLSIHPKDDLAIIECGVSLPDEMKILAHMVQPDAAILTTIESSHSTFLETPKKTWTEKSFLLRAVNNKGWCLLPTKALEFLKAENQILPIHWSVPQVSTDEPSSSFLRLSEPIHPFDQPKLNCDIAQLANRAAQLIGMQKSIIAKRIKQFQPDEMRLEMWRAFTGPIVVNDLYCGNFSSLIKTFEWADLFARNQRRKILWFKGVKYQNSKTLRRQFQQLTDEFGIENAVVNQINKQETPSIPHLCSKLAEGDLLIVRGTKKFDCESLARQLQIPLPPATLNIDLSIIAQNLGLIRHYLSSSIAIMAMLKAQAYGTDAEIMARFLAKCGVKIFGLASVEEAIFLRQGGIDKELFVLHAAQSQWELAVQNNLQICVSSRREIAGLAKISKRLNKTMQVHLHVDTGMCRLGCRPSEGFALAQFISEQAHLKLTGLMTHFASADEAHQLQFTENQKRVLESLLKKLKRHNIDPPYVHMANSAGALARNDLSCNLVRVGLALFGLTEPTLHPQLKLRPSLSLEAKIAHLHSIRRGQSVSYGRKYFATKEKERIAVIPLGYADGFQRQYSNASILVKGQRAPLIGTICMDFTMFDVTHIRGLRVGDTAEVFGMSNQNSLNAQQLALKLGVSTHELIACLGPRIQRIFTFDQKPISS